MARESFFTKVTSNITRSKTTGQIWVGAHYLDRIKAAKFQRGDLFSSKLTVEHKNGYVYTVQQQDRHHYWLEGPSLKGMFVDGWADAVRVLNNL